MPIYHCYPQAYARWGTSRPDDQPRDYKSAMGGMMLDSASSTGTGEQNIEDMEKSLEVKTEEDGADKE